MTGKIKLTQDELNFLTIKYCNKINPNTNKNYTEAEAVKEIINNFK